MIEYFKSLNIFEIVGISLVALPIIFLIVGYFRSLRIRGDKRDAEERLDQTILIFENHFAELEDKTNYNSLEKWADESREIFSQLKMQKDKFDREVNKLK